jgi:hypothetical protein
MKFELPLRVPVNLRFLADSIKPGGNSAGALGARSVSRGPVSPDIRTARW